MPVLLLKRHQLGETLLKEALFMHVARIITFKRQPTQQLFRHFELPLQVTALCWCTSLPLPLRNQLRTEIRFCPLCSCRKGSCCSCSFNTRSQEARERAAGSAQRAFGKTCTPHDIAQQAGFAAGCCIFFGHVLTHAQTVLVLAATLDVAREMDTQSMFRDESACAQHTLCGSYVYVNGQRLALHSFTPPGPHQGCCSCCSRWCRERISIRC
mmetsp:Transcript_88501/g.129422  ORF Transcript_88501/g.129422 Transcript_88501/m.129422 type:complete len:212 (-) Transcript_88501:46-681(-)